MEQLTDPLLTDPLIVGIGASAGGVQALQRFFEALPADTGAAFVVIVHLDPDFRSELPTILAGRTSMPVTHVGELAQLQPNHVYVISPNRELRIADHQIAALPFNKPRGQRAPIDYFFRSLAEQHVDGYAIILTGAGADGTLGVKAVKEAGGIVLVQDPREAEYASMPRSAIAAEVADFILPVRDLAERLVELLRNRRHALPSSNQLDAEDTLRRILAHVRMRTGHDFSQYKRATILRRIARRAQVSRKDSLTDYYGYLRDNVEEAQSLFHDFLISVTTFFRDPSTFDALSKSVIPRLFEGRETGGGIRVWVPGCATGEEAYTIGMLLLEESTRQDIRPEIQVFGSDLDAGTLATAREGCFPAAIEADLTEDRLRRFFLREGDHYRVRRELRDTVLFANHSLLRDPPFSKLDMISCRNLLIYLDRDLQRQICSTFHYALNPGGYLFLGSSENAEQLSGLFHLIDRDARIYQATANVGDKRPALPLLLSANRMSDRSAGVNRSAAPGGSAGDGALHRQMLEKIAPPSMLIDEAHRAIHLSDSAGRYLLSSGGPVTTDATELVRQELRFDLSTALHKAFEHNQGTFCAPIPVQFGPTSCHVSLYVKPVSQDENPARYALVLFMESGAEGTEQGVMQQLTERAPIGDGVQRLQEELRTTQSRLRATREESAAVTEELRAANEELQSINEEYRSTSEELETSKEELQSINEELQTVNSELKLKLETVSQSHSDLQNFMAATDVGTLFLDPSLRIKRFTPRIADLFNITESDEGRSITDFTHQLHYDDMANHARAVIADLAPLEKEVESLAGGFYLVRMRPYRTVEDKIDGVVVTFVDITGRRKAEDALLTSQEQLRQEMRLVELSRAPIFVWDFDDGIVQWNRGSEELYGYSRHEALGREKEVLLQTSVPGSSFQALRASLLTNGTWSGELIHRAKDGHFLTVESQIELATIGSRRLVLESTRDITDRKRWDRRQQLLLRELSHRVKNTLTVVQAMVRQTWRTAKSNEDFLERFEGRLLSLSGAHNLLVDTLWKGAELGALARNQLKAYFGGEREPIHISGESVTLPPEMATPFGLILHELATNAAKYGALSTKQGTVTLNWEVSERNNERRLLVIWKELGGPTVTMPDQRGFGSTLIEKGLPTATVMHDFLPQGVECRIEVPLTESNHGEVSD